jgi:preprotein translocase subunit SecF
MFFNEKSLVPYKFLINLFVFAFFLAGINPLFSQPLAPEEVTLKQQYESLMNVSTSYEDYKVIKIEKFNSFWENIQDSLAVTGAEKQKLRKTLENVKGDLINTQIKLGEITAKLDASDHDRDRISFIGIPLTKVVYNSLVWGIIIILAVMTLYFFSRFKRSNNITRSTKKECDTLYNEFDNYKKNSRDKELLLKRELQTAINTIDELRL